MVIKNGKADSREAGNSDGGHSRWAWNCSSTIAFETSSPKYTSHHIAAAGNEILIGFANKKFEDGELTHEVTLEFLDEVMERFVGFVKRTK